MNMMVFHSKPLNYQEGKRRTGNISIVGHVIQQAAGVPLLQSGAVVKGLAWPLVHQCKPMSMGERQSSRMKLLNFE
jgi:hypothetical protein